MNKFLPTQETADVLTMMKDLASVLLETTAVFESAVRIVFWEAKGLILRLMHTDEILELLLALLSKSERGFAIARGFGLLLAPDEVLSKENGAIVRLLAKQKVFNICVPAIAEQFRKAEQASKPNYLIALSGILKDMPTDIMIPEIDISLPLLLQSLDLEESDVKAAAIQSLTVISQESPKAIESHIGSLVSRLIGSTVNGKANTSSVRYNALRCLRILPGRITDSTLLPYKNTVTGGLSEVLDDPRRRVRNEAVECRAAWFNMDEPQSD